MIRAWQTMVLAQNINGNITGVDICSDFINVLNDNANRLDFGEKVKGEGHYCLDR